MMMVIIYTYIYQYSHIYYIDIYIYLIILYQFRYVDGRRFGQKRPRSDDTSSYRIHSAILHVVRFEKFTRIFYHDIRMLTKRIDEKRRTTIPLFDDELRLSSL